MKVDVEKTFLVDDDAFDTLYPSPIQLASRRFWTPVATARRAAELLRDRGAKRILDVGCGPGKFALVAAATVPHARWHGIELRPHLVEMALAGREALGLDNVTFEVGDATTAPWGAYDGFYFYNPFAENLFAAEDQLDARPDLTLDDFKRRVSRTDAALRAAPAGTMVATFHGLSGRVPCTFELVHAEMSVSGWLRLWVKMDAKDDGAFFVETGGALERHAAKR